jgi:hypothetical protein
MKTLFLFALLALAKLSLVAQEPVGRPISSLPRIDIILGVPLHFRSPEPIRYVDISSPAITYELTGENILCIRPGSLPEGKPADQPAVVTIIAETFMAQYSLHLGCGLPAWEAVTDIEILPEHMVPVNLPTAGACIPQIRKNALDILAMRLQKPISKISSHGLSLAVRQLYSIGELIFLDLYIENSSSLPYNTDVFSLSLEDKKITRATNHQSIPVPIVWQLYPFQAFTRRMRNVLVIDKLSFSPDKRLVLTLAEKQLSNRKVSLSIRYGDILRADTF